ncbi:MAG: preprotein translocase subunit SecY [Gammaproteobacteria bacterium]|nr:preprotein translocase subunit SecY [Gammaproteobacteria bacterium]MXY57974.1 preprotein translocase subunit SecY [Gammaproteobacteria bacterium]MYF31020.1 preprotein translocase subunit SecY [Gammaproteobacteria bacterium]MYK44969.1 preprotein translocase subunit SecY [Gammaproteobacteria bacterium]
MAAPAITGARSGGLSELRSRLLFVLFALLVYRIGTHIPVPGINPDQLRNLFDANQGGILDIFNMFSGGALERMSILALGVMPYITSSIIMNLLTMMYPTLNQLRKEGQAGRRKITKYTRYGTLLISLIQGSALTSTLAGQGLAFSATWDFYLVAIVTLVTGALFMMWLGEQINERGVGNGISLLIFAGIVSGLPGAVGQSFEAARQGDINILVLGAVAAIGIAIVGFVVFVESGQRRITVNYARRQQGRRMYQPQSHPLPFKINMAGVIPAIFASSLLLAPASMAQWFGQAPNMSWLQDVALVLSPGQPLYILLFAGGIIFFSFFYTALMRDPKELADDLKRQGAYIPGIRPGRQTADYLDDVITRLTFFGSIYVTVVCLLPEFMVVFFNITLQLGGTALLIVVVVSMDFMSQVQEHMMSSQYAKLMEKSNLRSYGRGGRAKTGRRGSSVPQRRR